MTRDYKQKPAPNSKGMSWMTLFVGLLTGLVIGLGIALAVAWYVNKLPNPFAQKPNTPAPGRPDPSRPEAPKAESPASRKSGAASDTASDQKTPGKTDAKLAKAEDGKPRFDFYKILPGTEEPLTEQDLKRGDQKSAPSRDVYFLQAGAFQNAADADNMKARLALMGMEASIQTVAVPDKGMLHRVRVGPFGSLDELNKVKSSLKQNGVQSTPIKIGEAQSR
jgi:cell division protein FtsN